MTRSDSASVLVAVDGSAASVDALLHGARIAAAYDVPLEAMTVWQYPSSMAESYSLADGWSPEADARQTLATAIDEAFLGEPPAGLRATVRSGPSAAVLISASRDATMLVVGSRGHGGFLGLLLGSVSAACAERAQCPVLVVHGSRMLGAPPEESSVGALAESLADRAETSSMARR